MSSWNLVFSVSALPCSVCPLVPLLVMFTTSVKVLTDCWNMVITKHAEPCPQTFIWSMLKRLTAEYVRCLQEFHAKQTLWKKIHAFKNKVLLIPFSTKFMKHHYIPRCYLWNIHLGTNTKPIILLLWLLCLPNTRPMQSTLYGLSHLIITIPWVEKYCYPIFYIHVNWDSDWITHMLADRVNNNSAFESMSGLL